MTLDPRVAVLVVDDQLIFRQAAASSVRPIDELRLVGEAADSEQAVSVARDIRSEFVVMDVRRPGMTGSLACVAPVPELTG